MCVQIKQNRSIVDITANPVVISNRSKSISKMLTLVIWNASCVSSELTLNSPPSAFGNNAFGQSVSGYECGRASRHEG